jgi:hypothetical protein
MARKMGEELTKDNISTTIRQLKDIFQKLIFIAEDVSIFCNILIVYTHGAYIMRYLYLF